jgi:non-specific serine/threonine protein kinase
LERPAALRPVELQVYASRFVGRRPELAEVSGLLETSRLVTLTGPPGSGKTRLAVELASAPRWGERTRLIELAALGEGALLPETFASAIGVRTPPASSALDALLEHLSDSDDLLLVDNCEHLVESCAALVDRILRHAASVRVLATSREPLRIDGERTWPVPPLALPPEDASPSRIASSEAVELFVERARQAAPRFKLNAENANLVASICRRLDGLPLALEVAAARAAAMDLTTIAEQLGDRFRFLTAGYRTAPARQRTLRAAIDWSYDLLTNAERQLLARMGVFAGSFDLAAVESVCAGGPVLKEQALDLLGRLVEKSLVIVVDQDPQSGRYRLLESLRAYGLDRLRESGELDLLRRRHAEHFASLVAVGSDTDPSWLPRTRLEIDNLREALAWSSKTDPALHLRLAVPFGRYCMRAGFLSEGRAWLESDVTDRVDDPALRMRAYEMAGLIAWRQGDFEAAGRVASSAVDAARSANDDAALAGALGTLAFIKIGALSFEGIDKVVHELRSLADQGKDLATMAAALYYEALLEAHGDDAARARELASESARLFEAAGKPEAAPQVYNVVGWMSLRLRDAESARAPIRRALEIRLQYHEIADLNSSFDAAAELAFLDGAAERAMRLKGAADALRDRLGSAPPSLALQSRARWVKEAEKLLGIRAHTAWREGRALTLDEAARYALASPAAPAPRAASHGSIALSSRELEIARFVAEGLTNAEIAGRLKLSRRTVDAHLEHIRTKLGARSRVEVATWVTAMSSPAPI